MPDDSIMDMVNNIEPLYDDKNNLYRKWIRQGKDWDENSAYREARALAAHFAESLEYTHVRGKYTISDFDQAAAEMIEEFKTEERPKWELGSSVMGQYIEYLPWRVKVRLPTGRFGPQGPIWETVYFNMLAESDMQARRAAQDKYPQGVITGSWLVREGFNPSELGSTHRSLRMGAVEGWVVTHDGETIKTGFKTDFDAVNWLHNRHSYSVDHAVRYEGYDIVLVRDGKVVYSYKQSQNLK